MDARHYGVILVLNDERRKTLTNSALYDEYKALLSDLSTIGIILAQCCDCGAMQLEEAL